MAPSESQARYAWGEAAESIGQALHNCDLAIDAEPDDWAQLISLLGQFLDDAEDHLSVVCDYLDHAEDNR